MTNNLFFDKILITINEVKKLKEVLFEIFGIKVYSYSVMITIGVLFFAWIYLFRLRKLNLADRIIDKLVIITLISGLFMYLGASFFDALWHSLGRAMVDGKIVWENFSFKFGSDGITYSGGILSAIWVFLILFPLAFPHDKRHVLYFMDHTMIGIVLAHAFGRLGCWFGGCCYGARTDFFLGVYYPPAQAIVHPTQLYEATFLFILFLVMFFFVKKYHTEIYLFSYGTWRFFLEFLRGDDRGASPFGVLTPSQLLSIVMYIMAIIFIIVRYLVYKKDLEEIKNNPNSPLQVRFFYRSHKHLFNGLLKKCNCPNCAKPMKLKWQSEFNKANEVALIHEEHLVYKCLECETIQEIK